MTDLVPPAPDRESSVSRPAAVVLRAVRAYQSVRRNQLSPCRFYPSCSTYAVEAVETYGAWRGGRLALRRLARCHPFGGHGIDLVPLRGPSGGERS